MLGKTRRKLEMGRRVLEFSRQHPETSAGYKAAATRLQELLSRASQLASRHVDGRSEVRSASVRKRELRRLMKRAHLNHLSNVAEMAAIEEPELLEKFVFPTDARTYLAFQAAANSMAAEALSRKDLLVKHGLSEEVLSNLEVALEQFETALEQGAAGRVAHVTAAAELETVGDEVVQVVKVMNGLIRLRFANQSEILTAWESASNVFATPRGETKPVSGTQPPAGGEIKPAA
jgi:hypothetical protein